MASTLKEISKLAGTSVSTASRIVNGQTGHRFSQETCDAVLAAARRLNYRPQKAAQSLATGKTNNVAVIVNNLANPFFGHFASLLQTGLMKRGMTAIPIEIRSEQVREEKVHWLDWVDQRDVDAAIDLQGYGTAPFNARELETYARFIQHRPLVVRRTDNQALGVPVDFVHVDYTTGETAMAHHLRDNGWRKVGVVTVRGHMPGHAGELMPGVSNPGYSAHLLSLFESVGMESRPNWWRGVDDERGGSPDWYHVTLDLLTQSPDFDTLVVHNIDAVPAVLQAVTKVGRTIGRDLALVSYDDLPAARWLGPGITVIREPYEQIADGLIELMFERMAGSHSPMRQLHVPTDLVVRRSTSTDAPR